MPFIGIYSWAQFAVPAGIPAANLLTDSHANDPASPIYDSLNPVSWIGQTFQFNGGAPTQIEITDDDGLFEDAYVETGAPQTLTVGVTIDGTFYPAGSSVQNEFVMLDGGGAQVFVVAINGTNVGFTYVNGDEPTVGEMFTGAINIDGAPVDNADGTSTSSFAYSGIICFAEGTQIATPGGARRVEELRCGDPILTQDDGAQPLQWVGRTQVPLCEGAEGRYPVLFPAGSLGRGLPARDLVVSQQHRMLIDKGGEEVFAPAKGLTPLRGVRMKRGMKTVTYFHLLLPRHAVIFAEGVATESFYPGATALRMMEVEPLRQVLRLHPGVVHDAEGIYGPLARPSLSVKAAREWAQRARDSDAALLPVPKRLRAVA